MNFASDNAYGVLPEMLAALASVNDGAVPSYGDDAATAALAAQLDRLFARPVAMFPVLTGTAANALALATLVPPHGAVLCHELSHIVVHECAAPEFFSHGARLVGLGGAGAKITPDAIAAALKSLPRGDVHVPQPWAVSLSQPTEMGTLYSLSEIKAIADLAHAQGLKLHVDGARFANAVAALGCSPADASYGIDALSFGATKGGALAAEAVIFLDPRDARDFAFRRKKGGHLVSKMRFVSAQLVAYLKDDLWLRHAARSNALASRLADGLKARGVWLAAPAEVNMVFAELAVATAQKLRSAGAKFHDWTPPEEGKVVVRLVTSFATPDGAVDEFLALLDR
jgi:threonine aldolase